MGNYIFYRDFSKLKKNPVDTGFFVLPCPIFAYLYNKCGYGGMKMFVVSMKPNRRKTVLYALLAGAVGICLLFFFFTGEKPGVVDTAAAPASVEMCIRDRWEDRYRAECH